MSNTSPFLDFFQENTRSVNKFNIHWQIVRTNARTIKDINNKIDYVLGFLNANKNIHNYGRVLNWLRMTKLGYPEKDRKIFENSIIALEKNKNAYNNISDDDNDLSKISTLDLKKVYNDLSKRKYGFQYKTVPKEHIEFLDQLKKELDTRHE